MVARSTRVRTHTHKSALRAHLSCDTRNKKHAIGGLWSQVQAALRLLCVCSGSTLKSVSALGLGLVVSSGPPLSFYLSDMAEQLGVSGARLDSINCLCSVSALSPSRDGDCPLSRACVQHFAHFISTQPHARQNTQPSHRRGVRDLAGSGVSGAEAAVPQRLRGVLGAAVGTGI